MATLEIVNNFSLAAQGVTAAGKQGAADDNFADAFQVTVSGVWHMLVGSLATATVVTAYDDDDDVPADWDYLYYWADQITYVQLVGSASNVIFKVAAKQPFVLPGYDSLLAAANTTPIAGGAEPALTDIDQVVLGNYSGNTANYLFCIID